MLACSPVKLISNVARKMFCLYQISQRCYLFILVLLVTTCSDVSILSTAKSASVNEVTTIAFIADQGVNENSIAVLNLIIDEGTDLLLAQGDFGYDEGPGAWISMMDQVLGKNFPVLGVAGNHDTREPTHWAIYQRWLEEKLPNIDGLVCSGNIGVKAVCQYRGISITQTTPGIDDVLPPGVNDDYAAYVKDRFADDNNNWRICSFHMNQTAMQTGFKRNAAGWPIYQACLAAGAIVATGHEHAYSRTWLMDSFEQQSVVHRETHMRLEPGKSFAFVSGLGGVGKRLQWRRGDWWGKILTRWQGADYGALFCRFEKTIARCEFKDIKGQVRDRFSVESALNP